MIGGEVDNIYVDLFDGSIIWVNIEDGVIVGFGYLVLGDLDEVMLVVIGSNFESNNLDLDFEMFSEWKIFVGMMYINEEDYVFNFDLLVSVI